MLPLLSLPTPAIAFASMIGLALASLAVPARAETPAASPEASPSAPDSPPPQDPSEPGGPSGRPERATQTTGGLGLPIALSVSSPLGWLDGSFGASAYVGLGHHHVVRANFARYEPISLSDFVAAATGGDSSGEGGRITDVGVGWVWYPRRLWDGLMLEAGALRRDRDTWVWPEFDPKVETRSTTYAGRALIGWSWLIKERAFIAIAVGGSLGRESGHETTTPNSGIPMSTTKEIAHARGDGEAYLRVGLAFGR